MDRGTFLHSYLERIKLDLTGWPIRPVLKGKGKGLMRSLVGLAYWLFPTWQKKDVGPQSNILWPDVGKSQYAIPPKDGQRWAAVL